MELRGDYMNYFRITTNTKIDIGFEKSKFNMLPIEKAIERWYRDINMVHEESCIPENYIILKYSELEKEEFYIDFDGKHQMIITSGSELGFIYALLYLSEKHLAIYPFWFWNDEEFRKTNHTDIPITKYKSPKKKIRYRGWFINDEVLIQEWKADKNNRYVWEMALETLLRCGGNMVIPGTDNNSKLNRQLACDMGLWISHHHAEPLGAEMFARAYPNMKPSYLENKELFHQLWEQAIEEQKEMNVIWNVGFRGQGDYPFWLDDPQYKTEEARGKLISNIINEQLDIIKKKINNPVCCTNLYGEIMELYKEELVEYPDELIKIWADNGYGKMVSRRQGNNNPRVFALPDKEIKEDKHGIYYHVSFYDLQAANHMTMFPNTLEFIKKELEGAFNQGVKEYLIVNCSNIKPHVYYLSAVADLWNEGELNIQEFEKQYINSYFNKYNTLLPSTVDLIREGYRKYGQSTILFGEHEDERAGEQFYNYITRMFISEWMKGNTDTSVENLQWATGTMDYSQQILWYKEKCIEGYETFSQLNNLCEEIKLKVSKFELFKDSLDLQVKMHLYCIKGAIEFCKGYEENQNKDYKKSFYHMGKAAEYYDEANHLMRSREHGKWKGFYENDCLTDIKHTGYLLKLIMGYIRNMDDGPHFYHWQRDYLYKDEDKNVILITNFENHMTDWELYELMKEGKEGV